MRSLNIGPSQSGLVKEERLAHMAWPKFPTRLKVLGSGV